MRQLAMHATDEEGGMSRSGHPGQAGRLERMKESKAREGALLMWLIPGERVD